MQKLNELFFLFFKLGLIAFGGPAAHIAMVEDEIVDKRKWMSTQEYLDIIGATNLIPGPNSTEVVMHCGLHRAGIVGMFVAGISFIFPAAILTGLFAWFYEVYGDLPQVSPFFDWFILAVLIIILMATVKLGKKATKSIELVVLGLLAIILCFYGFSEIVALLLIAAIGALYFSGKNAFIKHRLHSFIPILFLLQIAPLIKSDIPLIKIFVSFVKVGAILYGSGYVLIAYLDAELVANGLLSSSQLLDAIAVGQITPGPVLTAATFIGYQMGGFWGAVVATLGIFLPSFFFVSILDSILTKLRKSLFFSNFLDSVNVAAVAVMVYILVKTMESMLNEGILS